MTRSCPLGPGSDRVPDGHGFSERGTGYCPWACFPGGGWGGMRVELGIFIPWLLPRRDPHCCPVPPHPLGSQFPHLGVPLLCFCADPSVCLAELEAPGAFRRPLQGSCGTFFHFSSALFLNLLTIVKCLYAGLCLPPELI